MGQAGGLLVSATRMRMAEMAICSLSYKATGQKHSILDSAFVAMSLQVPGLSASLGGSIEP
jgi:hypothetical protein